MTDQHHATPEAPPEIPFHEVETEHFVVQYPTLFRVEDVGNIDDVELVLVADGNNLRFRPQCGIHFNEEHSPASRRFHGCDQCSFPAASGRQTSKC